MRERGKKKKGEKEKEGRNDLPDPVSVAGEACGKRRKKEENRRREKKKAGFPVLKPRREKKGSQKRGGGRQKTGGAAFVGINGLLSLNVLAGGKGREGEKERHLGKEKRERIGPSHSLTCSPCLSPEKSIGRGGESAHRLRVLIRQAYPESRKRGGKKKFEREGGEGGTGRATDGVPLRRRVEEKGESEKEDRWEGRFPLRRRWGKRRRGDSKRKKGGGVFWGQWTERRGRREEKGT